MARAGAKRKDIECSAVYDIETERWDTFIVGGIYTAEGTYEEFDWKNEDAFVDRLLEVRGTLWAHYGGGFDHKWLLDHMGKRGIEEIGIAAAGSRVIFAQAGEVTLADSYAVAPISLKDFTEGCGVHKEKLDLPCLKRAWCEEGCKGFCQINKTMTPEVDRRVREYLKADCVSLFEAIQRLREFYGQDKCTCEPIEGEHAKKCGYIFADLKKTIGSSAWEHAKRMLKLPPADLDKTDHAFARDAYFGGRVQVYQAGWVPVSIEHDVRSMYLWALRDNELPYGEHSKLEGTDAKRAYMDEQPGVYEVSIYQPYTFIPPLPFRTPKRIYYPWGLMRGTWTLPELQYAVELGAEIRYHHAALVWQESKVVFRKWVQNSFDIRHHKTPDGADSPLGTVEKFRGNSLTGKLGMDPQRWSYVMNPTHIIPCDTPELCGDDCNGDCGSMAQLSERIWRFRQYKLAPCMHVEWAAYLTSYARIRQHRQLVWGGKEDAVYGDTDGCISTENRTWEIGSDLGKWEFKKKHLNGIFWAPKVYESDDETGKHKVKAKGLPKGIARLEPGRIYSKEGIAGFASGAKSDRLFKRSKVSRQFHPTTGDRKIIDARYIEVEFKHGTEKILCGRTEPMSVEDARKDSRKR